MRGCLGDLGIRISGIRRADIGVWFRSGWRLVLDIGYWILGVGVECQGSRDWWWMVRLLCPGVRYEWR